MPSHLVDMLTFQNCVSDASFITNASSDGSIAICIRAGNVLIRDLQFSQRWNSVFLRWQNLPVCATLTVSAFDALMDFFLPFYVHSWRGTHIRDLYSNVFVLARKLVAYSKKCSVP